MAQNQAIEAVRHAIYADEMDLAAELLDSCGRQLVLDGQLKTVISWSEKLSPAIAEHHVPMQMAYCWSLLMCSRLKQAEQKVRVLVEQSSKMALSSKTELILLRAMLAYCRDKSLEILTILSELNSLPEDEFLMGVAANLKTIALCHKGDYNQARDVQLKIRQIRGFETQLLRCVAGECFVGLSFTLQGDMRQAEGIFRASLQKAIQQEGRHSEAACFAVSYLAEVLYETNQWSECQQLLLQSLDILDSMAPPDGLIRSYLALARIANRGLI